MLEICGLNPINRKRIFLHTNDTFTIILILYRHVPGSAANKSAKYCCKFSVNIDSLTTNLVGRFLGTLFITDRYRNCILQKEHQLKH